MKKSNHHGRHSFYGKNQLCSIDHYSEESFGKFGRMFRDGFSPLYTDAMDLDNLGRKDGPMDSLNEDRQTQSVPLGMIFFGQFVDHDITFDTTSRLDSVNIAGTIDNSRTPTLDLDCIFGAGPEAQPFLYDDPKKSLKLLTGKTNKNSGQKREFEVHDLARNGLGSAIIGDPRNDENRVISQLQLLMIRFYNKVYDIVAGKNKNYSSHEVYEQARQTTTFHYQWIVLNSFLPHICGHKVVHDILSQGRLYYKPKKEPFIPVEFSVAAYRFGHSMIRQKMKLNKDGAVLSIFEGDFGQGFSPISALSQVVDWSLFFDVDGTFQRSGRCDLKLPSGLLKLPFIREGSPSLATRNLLRGNSFLLPSGEEVARHLGEEQEDIDRVSSCFNLKGETPLWAYILAEASVFGKDDKSGKRIQGEGLGPVGARIVAEVLIGLMELDPKSFLSVNRNWLPDLGEKTNDFRFKHLIALIDE